MKYWKNISKNGEVDPFLHSVIVPFTNMESVIEHSTLPALKLKNEVVNWLNENIGNNNWSYHGIDVGFKLEEDAMGFILRWS